MALLDYETMMLRGHVPMFPKDRPLALHQAGGVGIMMIVKRSGECLLLLVSIQVEEYRAMKLGHVKKETRLSGDSMRLGAKQCLKHRAAAEVQEGRGGQPPQSRLA